MKDFQFEPDTTFRQTIEGKDENSFLGYEPKMALDIGQLEIKNKPEEFPNNDKKETLKIETIEMKDENSYEMEAQEDFELQLESDSDDDMNDNEIEPPTMDIKDDGKHFLGCSNQTQEPHNPLSLCLL